VRSSSSVPIGTLSDLETSPDAALARIHQSDRPYVSASKTVCPPETAEANRRSSVGPEPVIGLPFQLCGPDAPLLRPLLQALPQGRFHLGGRHAMLFKEVLDQKQRADFPD